MSRFIKKTVDIVFILLLILILSAMGIALAETVFSGFELYQGSALLTAFLFAGLPFGWMALRQIFGGILVWGLWAILIYYLCMLVFSFAIGWMILAYRLVRDIVQLIIVCRMEKAAATAEIS